MTQLEYHSSRVGRRANSLPLQFESPSMDEAANPDSKAARNRMPKVGIKVRPAKGGFDLLRWYSAVGLLAIGAVAVAFALIGTRFVASETLHRDAILTAQFIDSVMETESRHSNFEPRAVLAEFIDHRIDPEPHGFTKAQVAVARAEFYDHIGLLPDQLLANIYAPDHTIIWSTNRELVGKTHSDNEDLAEAFTSRSMVAKGHLERQHSKKEQEFVVEPSKLFIENYIPLRSKRGDVVAVVEIYKEPHDLLEIIARGERLVWISTFIAASLVYLVTFGIVRRGHRLLMHQQQQLVNAETMVTIGELSTTIAHSLRNPLASIRTSAELVMDDGTERTRKKATDIIAQVDRLSGWIKNLLHYSRPFAVHEEAVIIGSVVSEVVAGFQVQVADRNIQVSTQCPSYLPPVLGNHAMLVQAMSSVVSNAIEAIGDRPGGKIEIRAESNGAGRVTVVVSDNGIGMTREQLAKAFRPFVTTKQTGLGIGLSLVQQIMERFGAEVDLASEKDIGTDVFLHLRTA